jgi:hypothetical protein
MLRRIPFSLIFLLSLVYIGFGDQFLPRSIGQYSTQIRSSFDDMLVANFPSWRPKTQPNARTQEAIRNTESDKAPAQ